MSPTPQELEIGAKAYQQVRFYEKYTVRSMKQLPWILVFSRVMLMGIFYLSPSHYHKSDYGFVFVLIPVFMMVGWAQAITAKKLYASNKVLLNLLEDKHGDSLPWIQDEKALTASLDLEAAIKRGQPTI